MADSAQDYWNFYAKTISTPSETTFTVKESIGLSQNHGEQNSPIPQLQPQTLVSSIVHPLTHGSHSQTQSLVISSHYLLSTTV